MFWVLLAFLQVQGADRELLDARTVPAVLVADSEFRSLPQWRGAAKQLFQQALDPAGIHLHLVMETFWDAPDSTAGLPEMLRLARDTMLKNSQGRIVVLITGREPARLGAHENVDGYALTDAPWVVIKSGTQEKMLLSLRHELSHAFGLPHLPGRSVMAADAGKRTKDFSDQELEFLGAVRLMDFESDMPFARCNLDVVNDYYRLWESSGHGNSVFLANAGRALRGAGRHADAVLLFEAAAQRDPRNPELWYRIGEAREHAGLGMASGSAYRRSLLLNPASAYADSCRSGLARVGS